jgi:predicted lipoprotein with Yx(FWY)xxD motif
MRRTITAVLAIAATLIVAACGSDSNSGSGSGAAKTGSTTVAVMNVGGVKSALVDSSGAALYTPDQEANGSIHCTGGCVSIWKPLELASGSPKGDAGGGKLGVVERPDGTRQVTLGGKPLYTFAEDAAGKVTGNGVKDSFDGNSFTWHVVTASGKAPASGGGSGSGSYTY